MTTSAFKRVAQAALANVRWWPEADFAGRRLQGSLLRSERTWGGVGPMLLLMTQMYGPAAFRNRDCAWVLEVADMYPACLIGSRAVALMGIRTHL